MDARTKGIIATVASVILCACPGLFLCIFGAVGITGTPFQTDVNGVTGSTPMPTWMAASMLCLALILVLIPVVVGFFTLRKKPAAPAMGEPLPPAA